MQASPGTHKDSILNHKHTAVIWGYVLVTPSVKGVDTKEHPLHCLEGLLSPAEITRINPQHLPGSD